MNRKTLIKEIGKKLLKLREPLGCNNIEMADRLGAYRTSYYRYEKGETMPQVITLYKLSNSFDISLDWLICDKGPMYFRDKEPDAGEPAVEETAAGENQPTLGTGIPSLREDIAELLDHMERDPRLRYEMLAHFHRVKDGFTASPAALQGEREEE